MGEKKKITKQHRRITCWQWLFYLILGDIFYGVGYLNVYWFPSFHRVKEEASGLQEDAEEAVRPAGKAAVPLLRCFLVIGDSFIDLQSNISYSQTCCETPYG